MVREKLGFLLATEIIKMIIEGNLIDWISVVEKHEKNIEKSINQGKEGVIESEFTFMAPTGKNSIVFNTKIEGNRAKMTIACLKSERKDNLKLLDEVAKEL